MIPKTIHYCWFGGKKKPRLAQKCIASWKRYCPDYKIIEWNESNFDVFSTPYTRYCYENHKWAFLSDYVRLAVVFEHGGFYFDTDVELIAPMDGLLSYEAFFCFENPNIVATGLGFGAEAGNNLVCAMMKQYDFAEGSPIELRGCPILNTQALLPFGLKRNGKKQLLGNVAILPSEYMNPYDDPTGRLTITEKTVSIHWYSKSAQSKRAIIRSNLTRPFHRLFGVDCFKWVRK